MGKMDDVNTALDDWIDGDIVADRRNEATGERTVVFRNHHGHYSLARGFPVGDKAQVSMDLVDRTADQVIAHLLCTS